jgi:predicted nucleic acid-binding protein
MLTVADANIFLAVVLNEPEKGWIVEVTRSAEPIAPRSLPFEIVNALSRLVKRRLLTIDRAQLAWSATKHLPVSLCDVDLSAALRLACEHRMYAYDALMLQCARESSAPLLTLDRRLKAVARTLGIAIVE